MISISFTELRNNAKKHFDTVEHGQTLEIYRRGKPIAVISPAVSCRPRWAESRPVDLGGDYLSEAVLKERRKSR